MEDSHSYLGVGGSPWRSSGMGETLPTPRITLHPFSFSMALN